MKCTIVSLEAKVASNGNHYVVILAQPEGDPFAEEYRYKMWCSEALAAKLEAKWPDCIELRRASVKVTPYQRVTEEGEVNPYLFNTLSVVVRQFRGEDVDDPEKMAEKLRSSLLREGRIVEVVEDAFEGSVGDLPE